MIPPPPNMCRSCSLNYVTRMSTIRTIHTVSHHHPLVTQLLPTQWAITILWWPGPSVDRAPLLTGPLWWPGPSGDRAPLVTHATTTPIVIPPLSWVWCHNTQHDLLLVLSSVYCWHTLHLYPFHTGWKCRCGRGDKGKMTNSTFVAVSLPSFIISLEAWPCRLVMRRNFQIF